MKRTGAKGSSTKVDADGRVQRSVRSRERIVDALSELVAEGNLQPRAQQVAARAGVGIRTVFRHFDDMDGLYRELQARLRRALQPIADEPIGGGAIEDRVRALVRIRAAAFERAGPFLRAGAIHRWRSLFLSEAHKTDVREMRDRLAREIPEVEELPAPRREAIELLASFEAWDRLRTEQRLGRERAQDVIADAMLSLLSPDKGARRRRR